MTVLWIILGLLAVLILVLLLNTFINVTKAPKFTGEMPRFSEEDLLV